MRQPRRRPSRVVCLIEQNRLAAEYLVALLAKDASLSPLLFENLARPGVLDSSEPVFVLDDWALSPPLGEWLRRLWHRYPKAAYVVVDKEPSDDHIVRLLSLGVHGFLRHREVARYLLDAVHAVAEGGIWASPEALRAYVSFRPAANRCHPGSTTPREADILELAKRRLSNKEIASVLRIQESTVKFHLSNIFAKLRVTGRQALLDKNDTLPGWAETLGSSHLPP